MADEVNLDLPENEVGVIKLSIEAGKEGEECRPYMELHKAEVGVADEAKTKKFVTEQ